MVGLVRDAREESLPRIYADKRRSAFIRVYPRLMFYSTIQVSPLLINFSRLPGPVFATAASI